MSVKIVVTLDRASLQDVQDYVTMVKDRLAQPNPTESVKKVAEVWKQRFDAEGRGNWPPLQPATVADRISKGYGAGPMLVRSRSLRHAALTLFLSGSPGTRTWRDARGIPTTSSFSVSGGTATLEMSGVKIKHQTGNWNHPARPFWFTDPTTVEAAKIGIVEWIEKEVLKP